MPLQDLQTRTRVIIAALLICAVAVLDWQVEAPIGFGFLYLFPVLLIGTAGRRWHIILTAAVCTVLADQLDPFPLSVGVSLPQGLLVFTALAGTGLFAYEVNRSRRREAESMQQIRDEAAARRAAEEQLAFLIDSSPAAILTTGPEGAILLANAAAHRLFGVAPGVLPGRNAGSYLPALACVPSIEHAPQGFRTGMQCRGVRENGDVFLANVFFSTYRTAMGPRLAALVVDASEELRERAESSLEQLMAGSRILMGAVSHEVRNVCGAIAVVHENLVRGGALEGNKDFDALGSLVETLNRIASVELKHSAADPPAEGIDLVEVLDDLRIVLEPICDDAGIALSWSVPRDLPPVWADRHSLMQVLLNLTKNSERAMENAGVKRIGIAVSGERGGVAIRVTDTGPGIAHPGNLFQPFQSGADSTGLGLYLSRAFMRSFRGDLRHDPAVPGCCFVIELAKAAIPAEAGFGRAENYGANPAVAAR